MVTSADNIVIIYPPQLKAVATQLHDHLGLKHPPVCADSDAPSGAAVYWKTYVHDRVLNSTPQQKARC